MVKKSNTPAPFDAARTEFFQLTTTGLQIKGKPPLDVCREYLGTIDKVDANLDTMKTAVQLARADLCAFIEDNYPDQLENVLDAFDVRHRTYRNMKSVAKAFPIEEREPGIAYGHMQALQRVKDPVKRKSYIARVKKKEIKNVHHLRAKIKIEEKEEAQGRALSLREIIDSYPKHQVVQMIMNIIEAIDHEANTTLLKDVRGAFMAFGQRLDERIRTYGDDI